jgi:alkanesulfonate monooxygenase SsuD/methylene tetrahydromethanopterin reductase-like flavin-dependent oxidoreductase (luciferase family)
MLRSVKVAQIFDYPLLGRFWRDPTTPTCDGWSMLAAMAAVTSQIRIGCMVTGVTYRHPAILAKMAVSVDHISAGRLEFGIGAAIHEGEHRGYGIPFPPAGTRVAMLDEACEIIRRLWVEDRVDHRGQFWTLTGAVANPKPRQARIPMMIGGTGPRMLRVVARHADEWNFSPLSGIGPDAPDQFIQLSNAIDRHSEEIGREPKEIRRSVQILLPSDDRAELDAKLRQLDAFVPQAPITSCWRSPLRRPARCSSRWLRSPRASGGPRADCR